MYKFFAVILFSLVTCVHYVTAQADTLKVMTYNLLNFPDVSSNRIDTLKVILQHVKPDILIVNELTSLFGANAILNNALNQNGITYYAKANWQDGPDTDNMLYYNTQKIGLKSQKQIATSLRDVSEYKIYYKSADIATNPDTIYAHVYSCHLKAGSTASDESSRNNESQYLKSRIGFVQPENCIVGGDFNLYTYLEPAYSTITTANSYQLFDPIGVTGAWHSNSFYKSHFTQSTRTSSFDGGSTGGLDDRFDWFFVNSNIINGTQGMKYNVGSYRAVGQDGRINVSLISPLNSSEPQEVITALYNMSDHLPVYMELLVGREVMVTELSATGAFYSVTGLDGKSIHISGKEGTQPVKIDVIDMQGRICKSVVNPLASQFIVTADMLSPGFYLVRISDNDPGKGGVYRFLKY